MGLSYETNHYVIPRGRVFFDRFDQAGHPTGERYLGNCPGFTVEIKSEKAEHYSSESGLRQKDMSIVVQVDRTGTLTVDNLSLDNLALFIAGDLATLAQAADSAVVEELDVIQGRYYQLGVTAQSPVGARDISGLVVTGTDSSATTYVEDEDYAVDAALGRVQILVGGAIAATGTPETAEFAYAQAASAWDLAATGTVSELRGAIRFVADNASGDNRDVYMPTVSLAPTGELKLVADDTDFNAMEFALDILAPSGGSAIYFSGRPVA